MTDRAKGFIVVLEKDLRVDDAQHIQDAIELLQGVVKVRKNLHRGVEDIILLEQIRGRLTRKIWDALLGDESDA